MNLVSNTVAGALGTLLGAFLMFNFDRYFACVFEQHYENAVIFCVLIAVIGICIGWILRSVAAKVISFSSNRQGPIAKLRAKKADAEYAKKKNSEVLRKNEAAFRSEGNIFKKALAVVVYRAGGSVIVKEWQANQIDENYFTGYADNVMFFETEAIGVDRSKVKLLEWLNHTFDEKPELLTSIDYSAISKVKKMYGIE